jgi:PAS domain S-box-containing protein
MMGDRWSGAELDRLGRAVLEAAPDAIILADREGVIRFWNPGAERLFGFAAAEALGRPLDTIVPEPQRARHWAGFNRVMETGESRYGVGEVLAVPGLRKDGGRISLEFTIVPLRDPAGRMEGIAAILRDVTRRFEELRALRRQVAAVREGGAAEPQSGPGPGAPPASLADMVAPAPRSVFPEAGTSPALPHQILRPGCVPT